MYLDIIETLGLDYDLYLAISDLVHQDLFSQKAAQMIIGRNSLKMIVIDIEKQEVIKWIT